MACVLTLDVGRARAVAGNLLAAYAADGIFGTRDMPEDRPPAGVEEGSEEHLRFITLTVAIDYMRDADLLWQSARASYEDPETAFLFDPEQVSDSGLKRVVDAMRRHGLSRKVNNDPQIWQSICTTLSMRYEGRVGSLISDARTDAMRLISLVRSSKNGHFPFLRGPKIAPLWIRMLHDNCRVPLARMHEVPIPVDIHIAQATLQTGCVLPPPRSGAMGELRDATIRVWKEALGGSASYPLRLDEPLWHLSRRGCRVRTQWPCELRARCPVGDFCHRLPLRLEVKGNAGEDRSEWRII